MKSPMFLLPECCFSAQKSLLAIFVSVTHSMCAAVQSSFFKHHKVTAWLLITALLSQSSLRCLFPMMNQFYIQVFTITHLQIFVNIYNNWHSYIWDTVVLFILKNYITTINNRLSLGNSNFWLIYHVTVNYIIQYTKSEKNVKPKELLFMSL